MSDYLHHVRWAAAFLAREQRIMPLDTALCADKSTEECFRMMREHYGSEHMKKAVLAVYEIRPDLFSRPPPELYDPELIQDVSPAAGHGEPPPSSRERNVEQKFRQADGMSKSV